MIRHLTALVVSMMVASMLLGSSGTDSLPQLDLEAPPELRAMASDIAGLPPERFGPAMSLIGLDRAGAPIQVVLAPEGSREALAAEDWVAGYAYGALGRVVLLVDRTPRYPDGSLEELLDHEVAHVLIARAAGNRPVPRWFNEGVAMVAGHSWGLGDSSRLVLAMVRRSDLPVADLERLFAGSRGDVARAYALSGALVRDLLRRYGDQVVARVLEGVRLGLGFDGAVRRATGRDVAALEAAFWRRHSFTYRWVPFLTSSFTLWAGITLLAVFAFRKRRQRDAEIKERWELEEDLAEGRAEEN